MTQTSAWQLRLHVLLEPMQTMLLVCACTLLGALLSEYPLPSNMSQIIHLNLACPNVLLSPPPTWTGPTWLRNYVLPFALTTTTGSMPPRNAKLNADSRQAGRGPTLRNSLTLKINFVFLFALHTRDKLSENWQHTRACRHHTVPAKPGQKYKWILEDALQLARWLTQV